MASLVGDPGAAVVHVNDAAFLKTVFDKEVLHDQIIRVCVDSDIGYPLHTVRQTSDKNAFYTAVSGDSVDGSIGHFVQPAALLYYLVSRVAADDKGKNSTDLIFLFYDMTLSFPDIFFQNCQGGSVVSPLGGISVLFHLFPCISVDREDLREIGGDGFSDEHFLCAFRKSFFFSLFDVSSFISQLL